jgi:transposase-like protein
MRRKRTLTCEYCSQPFTSRYKSRFCSHSCVASATARHAIKPGLRDEVVTAYQNGESSTSIAERFNCSDDAVRDTLKKAGVKIRKRGTPPAPLGTKKTNSRGYVYVMTNDSWRPEHRVVMESKIGSTLSPNEHVHHENEDRSDNSPDNLEILDRSEHGRKHHGISNETISIIRNMYITGDKVSHIQKTSGVSLQTIYKHISDLPKRNGTGYPECRRTVNYIEE